MKNFYSVFAIAILLIYSASCDAQTSTQQETTSLEEAETVAVYYFHFSWRCVTCKTVEAEAKEAVETLYPEQYKENRIIFESINLDTEEGMKLAEKHGVAGQSLLIVHGNDKVDLVREGFMYARIAPDKFHQAIRQHIDAML